MPCSRIRSATAVTSLASGCGFFSSAVALLPFEFEVEGELAADLVPHAVRMAAPTPVTPNTKKLRRELSSWSIFKSLITDQEGCQFTAPSPIKYCRDASAWKTSSAHPAG